MLIIGITLAAILVAMLVNNRSMTDLRTEFGCRFVDLGGNLNHGFDGLDRHIDDMFAVVRAEMKADRVEMNAKLDSMRLETNSKLDRVLTMMAGMDQRITRLEDRAR